MIDGVELPLVLEYIQISAVALVLYDYLLIFNDEIRYVWKGRKSWIFYLYIFHRVLLLLYQFWRIAYLIVDPNAWGLVPEWKIRLMVVDTYIQAKITPVFVFFSDIFVTLRIFAITSKSKVLTTYIATLALARLVTGLISFIIPIETSTAAFFSLGTAFETSAFAIVVWCTYRHKSALMFSGLIRAIAAQATVYFLAIFAVQVYIQLQQLLVPMRFGFFQFLSYNMYCLLCPVLTLRFVILLKKSADPEGGEQWQLKHFTTIEFASPDTQYSLVCETTEMDPVDGPYGQIQMCESRSSVGEAGMEDV